MKRKIAFVGFRHNHIVSLYQRLKSDPSFEVVAACEENAEAAEQAQKEWGVTITHRDFDAMLSGTAFDVLAIGDYFGIRGKRAIAGLRAGKHIVADKPLCTSLCELDEVRQLVAKKELKVGLMLDFRTHGNVLAAKELIDSGRLGAVDAIAFGGQHPLNYGTRAAWYFEPGKQGGTINDIAIHGLDAIEFMTGSPITELNAARTWNAKATEAPDFHDAAQVMFALENRCGVIADVSYFAPENTGFSNPLYWRFTIWGRKGVLEFNYWDNGCRFYASGAIAPEELPALPLKRDFWDIFQDELDGKSDAFGTEHLLNVSEKCLKLQQMADEKL